MAARAIAAVFMISSPDNKTWPEAGPLPGKSQMN
jgi:hypothetical protein